MAEYIAKRTGISGHYEYRGYGIRDARNGRVYENEAFINGRTWQIYDIEDDKEIEADYVFVEDLYPSKRSCMNAIDKKIKREIEKRNKIKKEIKEDSAFSKLKKTINEALNTYETERDKIS